MKEKELIELLEKVRFENEEISNKLKKECSILQYEYLVKDNIWTNALRKALSENEIVNFPLREEPYLIDETIIIPSNRKLIGNHSRIKMANGMDTILFKNEHTIDETSFLYKGQLLDENVTIFGLEFEEPYMQRMGYGRSGKYDKARTFYGVSTCLFFNNLKHLRIENVTFTHCAAFAIQIGLIENAIFKDIHFNDCFADGIHLCGNVKNIYISNVDGNVGDDLVALNMYDWQNSSVNFGPGENIICENLYLDGMAKYKALRIESGIYKFNDGTEVDCYLKNAIIKDIVGIRTFKMYLQTPPYIIGTKPEYGKTGSMDNLIFENIDVDLYAPIDKFKEYMEGDKLRGACGAFEICSNISKITFRNVRIKMYKDDLPESYIVVIGPKSIVYNGKEVFDPYLSCKVDEILFDNVYVNGEKVEKLDGLIKEVSFSDINRDGNSTGKGVLKKIRKT